MRTFVIAAAGAAALALAPPLAAQPSAAEEGRGDGVEAARAAVIAIDGDRLARDAAYAEDMLVHLDRLADWQGGDARFRDGVRAYRLMAWGTLGRSEPIAATLDGVIAAPPGEPRAYGPPVYAALRIEDWSRAVALVEAASRNVRGIGWPTLRETLIDENMARVLWELGRREQEALRFRLAEALFRIGWPSDGDLASADGLRLILVDGMLQRGNPSAAAEYASGIASVDGALGLIVQRRYDAVMPGGQAPMALLEDVLATQDRATASALAAVPAHPKRLLNRVQYLRNVGRNAEAWELVAPLVEDLTGTIDASKEGMWLLNEAAYALLAEGRADEAVALTARMADLPLADNPNLISVSINHGALLVDAGRYAAGVDHARALAAREENYASPYGEMWIYNTIVCGLSGLGRPEEAAPWLERMLALGENVNDAALTQAHLCLGDDDSAARLMVGRLEKDDPGPALLALQDYALSRGPGQIGRWHDRLAALRDRPEVRAALERVGRVLTLPVARTYWGNF